MHGIPTFNALEAFQLRWKYKSHEAHQSPEDFEWVTIDTTGLVQVWPNHHRDLDFKAPHVESGIWIGYNKQYPWMLGRIETHGYTIPLNKAEKSMIKITDPQAQDLISYLNTL